MTEPYHQDSHIKIYLGDCRAMTELEDESIQCVITSPPYWGLRKYSGEQDLIWGDNHCEHRWVNREYLMHSGRGDAQKSGKYSTQEPVPDTPMADNICSLCGAWKGAFGLEPTPEMYVQHTIEILREIRRVLRKDGVVFYNIGDSYASSPPGHCKTWQHGNEDTRDKTMVRRSTVSGSLKPKDLCLIPFRIALAAQEDKWFVRSVIIWSKPNPMPESVTDRPTESHEYILMLTKAKNYYWDADAVREPQSDNTHSRGKSPVDKSDGLQVDGKISHKDWMKYTNDWLYHPLGRNLRTVWEFPTQPYPEAHFAVFPEKLPELCIKAATPEVGCCSKCGKPWARITENKPMEIRRTDWGDKAGNRTASSGTMLKPAESQTLGWQPSCNCNADKVPSVVLDNFCGTGTTLWVAKKLGRRAVSYDISEEYCKLALERNRQYAMGI